MTCLTGSRRHTVCSGLALGLVTLNPSLGLAQSCTQTLNPGANIASAVSEASGGSTICLNSGTYVTATISGVVKNPRVIVRSSTGRGASIGLILQNGTNGITVDSVTMVGAELAGKTTKNITVQN